jgi:hypothetical protein
MRALTRLLYGGIFFSRIDFREAGYGGAKSFIVQIRFGPKLGL